MKHFTSDPHFGHSLVLTKEFVERPFTNIHEHDNHLLDQINRQVGARDELFILGDYCLGAMKWARKYRPKIRCRSVHLIMGNHDRYSYRELFTTTQDTLVVRLGKDRMPCFLSHYPHAYWPGSHKGWMHLYGHVHTRYEHELDQKFFGRRSMECSVDNAKLVLGEYRPFSEAEVLDILGPRVGHEKRIGSQEANEILNNLRRA